MNSGLYAGVVSHVRLRPRRHALRYRVFMTLIDLDELERLDRLALFAVNRAGLLSFHERDHADGAPGSLKAKIAAELKAAELDLGGGPVRLLCMPRMLGFVFNPISVYFCHRPDGRLGAMIYEVSNTFGERHSYLIPVVQGDGPIDQRCAKRLFVSPFMGMDMAYRFRVHPPTDDVAMLIDGDDAEGPLIVTRFAGRRSELTNGAILGAVLAHPLMTLMVVAAIHWEALKLFMKGIRLVPRPKVSAGPVTVVR